MPLLLQKRTTVDFMEGVSVVTGERKKNVRETANRVRRSDFVDGDRNVLDILTECCGLFCCDGSVM